MLTSPGRLFCAVLMASLLTLSTPAAPPTPLAYWSFDEDAEATRQVNDLTGNSNSGILFGAGDVFPTFSSDVPAALSGGRSLSFADANDQYVGLDMSFSGLGALPTVSASAWFNTSAMGPPTGSVQQNNWAILDFDRSEYFNVYVRDTDGAIGFSTNAGGPGADIHDQVGMTTGLNDGMWHHVAVVYDGTDKRIYVDGMLDGTAANAHGGSSLGSSNPRFGLIGDGTEASQFNGTRNNLHYDGAVDDLAVWDQVISDVEIANLAAGTASPGDSLLPLPQFSPGVHTIDFESLTGIPEGSVLGNRIAGMTFQGAMVAFEGTSPRFAHTALGIADGVAPGELAGGVMISDVADIAQNAGDPVAPAPFNPIVVTWNGLAVQDLSFQVVDIDGNHQLRASVYDQELGGNLLETITITAGDPGTGDGIATLVDFAGVSGIKRLEFEVENVGAGNSGFAADNFRFTVIPEPSTLVLGGLGCLSLAWRRRRLA